MPGCSIVPGLIFFTSRLLSSRVCLRSITFHPEAIAAGKNALGAFSSNSTVNGSTVRISVTASKILWRGEIMPRGGKMMRSKVALMSSEVSSAPSWNNTPSRRWKV